MDLNKLESFVCETVEAIPPRFQGVVVACSGGLDSSVLFHLFCKILKAKGKISLALCHVHFGLRGEESDGDEMFLKALAESWQVPFFVHRVPPGSQPPSGIQVWAREVRYRFFETLAQKGWAVAIAHTQDDCVENILMRLFRGVP